MKYATEKQMAFAGRLLNDVMGKAGNLSESEANSLAQSLSDHQATMTKVAASEDCEMSKVSSLIDALMDAKNSYFPEIRWKKFDNGDWVIYGPVKMEAGQTVQVTSAKGERDVVVGEVLYTDDDGITYAKPAPKEKQDAKNPPVTEPGFYHRNDGEIVEAYYTRNGFLVGRLILEEGGKEYLGKAGLYNLGAKLTLDEIKLWGQETVCCMICGTRLEKETSKEIGIGPICLKNVGLLY